MSTIKSSTTTTTAYSVSADTTGTLVIQTGVTPTTAVTVGTDQSVTLAGTLSLASQNMSPYTGFKNRIINGAMVIDQRATSLTNSGYSVDRWEYSASAASKLTIAQSTTATTGFINSLLATSSSAYSIAVGDYFALGQKIEGLNVADLAWGTASAATVTLSFWVRSSLTGTFGGAVRNSAFNRAYPFAYTISSANTWEQKTITIAGDTSGTWLTTNGLGISLVFGLGVGSTYSATAGAWTAGSIISATGATSVVGTNGATFYITGVQLEKGSTATSFDYRPYTTELQLCQRYCAVWNANLIGMMGQAISTTQAILPLNYPVTPRTSATGITSTGTFSVYGASAGGIGVTALAYNNASDNQIQLVITVASGLVAGNATGLINGTKVIATGMEL